jgi:gluconate kinase
MVSVYCLKIKFEKHTKLSSALFFCCVLHIQTLRVNCVMSSASVYLYTGSHSLINSRLSSRQSHYVDVPLEVGSLPTG